MIGVIEFLDQHSGSLMVIITMVYVVATAMICWANFRSAKASKEQLLEMRKQFEEENRPRIDVEFLYANKSFYGLRFINTGKTIAQKVCIQLDKSFIDSLSEPPFPELLRKQVGKECIIGIGQHYDLFFGTEKYRENPDKVPAKGTITYRDSKKEFSDSFHIDLERYMTIFSVESDEDRLLGKLNKQNQQLDGIKRAIQVIANNSNKED